MVHHWKPDFPVVDEGAPFLNIEFEHPDLYGSATAMGDFDFLHHHHHHHHAHRSLISFLHSFSPSFVLVVDGRIYTYYPSNPLVSSSKPRALSS
jgi:hypothetical protein